MRPAVKSKSRRSTSTSSRKKIPAKVQSSLMSSRSSSLHKSKSYIDQEKQYLDQVKMNEAKSQTQKYKEAYEKTK